RRKLADAPLRIVTVRGTGYLLQAMEPGDGGDTR
ncbi:DNA-binding response regulator, partial [Xanthomonas sp. Kuri4-2]